MKLYDDKGYLNFREIRDRGYPYNIVIGGRGTGKTFGALQTSVEDELPFMFMRRLQNEADIIKAPDFSPIRPVCRATGWKIKAVPVVKGIGGFARYELNDEGKEVVLGQPLGYICALSTIGKVRGFDSARVKILIYDEFLPEKGSRVLKNEYDILMNAYETLNRNRELEGQKPLQLFCLANANDLASPVLLRLNLVKRLDTMIKKGTQIWTDDKRGILLCVLQDSPISTAKASTALYRLTEGSDYAGMALSNNFAYEERGRIASRPLGEYKPVVTVGELTVYVHKSRREFYCTTHRSGSCPRYDTGDHSLERFRQAYGWLWKEAMTDNIEYEEYLCQALLLRYIG